jgi:hypothetical protein
LIGVPISSNESTGRCHNHSLPGFNLAKSLKTYTSRVSVQRKHEISKAHTGDVLIPENASTDNENIVNNEHDEFSMNDVESDIVVDGVINLTPAEITEFMMPKIFGFILNNLH